MWTCGGGIDGGGEVALVDKTTGCGRAGLVQGDVGAWAGGEAVGDGEGREADGQALEGGRLQVGEAEVEEATVEGVVGVGGSQDRCWRSRQSSKVLSWGNLNREHRLTNKLIFFGGTRCRSVGRQLDNELEEPGVVELEGEEQQ